MLDETPVSTIYISNSKLSERKWFQGWVIDSSHFLQSAGDGDGAVSSQVNNGQKVAIHWSSVVDYWAHGQWLTFSHNGAS